MAVRKESIKKQANEMVAQALRPGEQIISGVYAITGPSPWLMNQLGLLGQFFIDYYYIAVTQQQVIFVKVNRLSNRPKEISFTAPIQSVRISDYNRSSLWSSFRYSVPTAAKLLPLRRNFSSPQSHPVQHKPPADLGEVGFPQNFSAALFRLFGAAPGRATVARTRLAAPFRVHLPPASGRRAHW